VGERITPSVSKEDYLQRPAFEPYLSDGSLLPRDRVIPPARVLEPLAEKPFPNPAAKKGLME
jgi:hypothetical protein